LFSHCTETALSTQAPALWAKVFGALGVPLELVKSGCCGMCGVYGHEHAHKKDSLGIFDLSWRSKVDSERGQGRVLVTGHSCRTQVERALGFTPLHPAQALVSSLEQRAKALPLAGLAPAEEKVTAAVDLSASRSS
jgi:Fe-S oxidoreductase